MRTIREPRPIVLGIESQLCLGLPCCLSVLIPVVGVVLNWVVLMLSTKDTNANTCGMIEIVLVWIVTIIGLAVMGLYLLLLWAYNWHRH